MTQPTTTNSNKSARTPSQTGARILFGITVSLSVVFWLAIFAQLTFLAPMTQKWICEYNMRIPWLTERVMLDFWWIVPGIAIAAIVICAVLRKRWAWGFVFLVLPLLVNSFVTLSLFIPTLNLLAGLSGQLAAH